MTLFGQDKNGTVWVFGINTMGWKLVAFWTAIAFFVEAPDAMKGLRTAGITLVLMMVFCWFGRLLGRLLGL